MAKGKDKPKREKKQKKVADSKTISSEGTQIMGGRPRQTVTEGVMISSGVNPASGTGRQSGVQIHSAR